MSKSPRRIVARFLTLPENLIAREAIDSLVAFLQSDRSRPPCNPLFLHGPPGTGKSLLASFLASEAASHGKQVCHLFGSDMRAQPVRGGSPQRELTPQCLRESVEHDLLILEDLHHLSPAAAEVLPLVIDQRLAADLPMLFTACSGPRTLAHRGVRFAARLTSRLAAGLSVALQPLQAGSRRAFLLEMAQRRQMLLPADVLDWLAGNLVANGRQLEGAVTQLDTLCRLGKRIDLDLVARHFGPQVEASRPTIERIVERVGECFRVPRDGLQSRRRHRDVLLPRQVGMYLARKLTGLSLEQIGVCFGGRDHTTVMHACRKVEDAMRGDAVLEGVVQDLHAQLA